MLKYKLIERSNPRNLKAPRKLYASPLLKGKKTLPQISKDIADISSLSRGDVHNVLLNLVGQLPKYLLDGHSVSLGELGTFRISFSSEGVESRQDFNIQKIKGLKVVFTPSKSIKSELEKASFSRI